MIQSIVSNVIEIALVDTRVSKSATVGTEIFFLIFLPRPTLLLYNSSNELGAPIINAGVET